MQTKKLSLANIEGKLSRAEMKTVAAGSGCAIVCSNGATYWASGSSITSCGSYGYWTSGVYHRLC